MMMSEGRIPKSFTASEELLAQGVGYFSILLIYPSAC